MTTVDDVVSPPADAVKVNVYDLASLKSTAAAVVIAPVLELTLKFTRAVSRSYAVSCRAAGVILKAAHAGNRSPDAGVFVQRCVC